MVDNMNFKGGFNDLSKILDRLENLQNPDTGAFRSEDKINHSTPQEGVFSTIEGIVPFLLFPYDEVYPDVILKGINYLIKVTDESDGKINPIPEYPNYDESFGSVDGAAYTLYVFTLARHFIKKQSNDDKIRQSIEKQISLLLQYIKQNQNDDNGWGIVKYSNLKSRTYSTSLVVFALNNCEEKDFDNAKVNGKDLLQNGVQFLLEKNIKIEDGEMKWYFSEPCDDDFEDIKNTKKQYNTNITAVVIFSLSHVLHTKWSDWRDGEWDDKIEKAVSFGANYIIKTLFDDSSNPTFEDVIEPVSYPFSEKKSAATVIRTHEYHHTYQMILPSFVLAPGISIYSNECGNIKKHIFKTVSDRLDDDGSYSIKTNLKTYELADSAFALTYYYCLNLGIEGCINNILKKGELFECLIRDDGNVGFCYNWNLYKSKLVSAHNEEMEALEDSHDQKIKALKTIHSDEIEALKAEHNPIKKIYNLLYTYRNKIPGNISYKNILITFIISYTVSILALAIKKEISLSQLTKLVQIDFYTSVESILKCRIKPR